jgi:hypothetical protein
MRKAEGMLPGLTFMDSFPPVGLSSFCRTALVGTTLPGIAPTAAIPVFFSRSPLRGRQLVWSLFKGQFSGLSCLRVFKLLSKSAAAAQ